jgi:hypothetical protein
MFMFMFMFMHHVMEKANEDNTRNESLGAFLRMCADSDCRTAAAAAPGSAQRCEFARGASNTRWCLFWSGRQARDHCSTKRLLLAALLGAQAGVKEFKAQDTYHVQTYPGYMFEARDREGGLVKKVTIESAVKIASGEDDSCLSLSGYASGHKPPIGRS